MCLHAKCMTFEMYPDRAECTLVLKVQGPRRHPVGHQPSRLTLTRPWLLILSLQPTGSVVKLVHIDPNNKRKEALRLEGRSGRGRGSAGPPAAVLSAEC
jgi:hypothetical protein